MGAVGLLVDGLLALILVVSAAGVVAAKAQGRRQSRTAGVPGALWPWVALFVAAAVTLVALPFIAAHSAESSTGWSDVDGDGMLDGFTNGSYDWFDVVGGSCARYWFFGLLIVAAVSGVVSVRLERHDRRVRTDQP
jgi:hypothetical protein